MRCSLSTLATATAALLAACAAPHHTSVHADVAVGRPWTPPPPAYPPSPPPVSVYVEPPLVQPPPVLIDVAPPPMLVEVPPPPPYPGAVWTGGYWGWQGRWVWCAGRWLEPPRPGYVWMQPYYEHRDGAIVFVPGFWAAEHVAFVPPPRGLHLSLEIAIGGGSRPMGPEGVFVPPPPGSRPGLIVPAPVGTAPAVVVSAPPIVNVGMRVQQNVTNTTNVTNVTHVTNVTNNVNTVNNVTIVAPASATANGRAFEGHAPAAAHLAAAMPPVVHAAAPVPTNPTPVPIYSAQHMAPDRNAGPAFGAPGGHGAPSAPVGPQGLPEQTAAQAGPRSQMDRPGSQPPQGQPAQGVGNAPQMQPLAQPHSPASQAWENGLPRPSSPAEVGRESPEMQRGQGTRQAAGMHPPADLRQAPDARWAPDAAPANDRHDSHDGHDGHRARDGRDYRDAYARPSDVRPEGNEARGAHGAHPQEARPQDAHGHPAPQHAAPGRPGAPSHEEGKRVPGKDKEHPRKEEAERAERER